LNILNLELTTTDKEQALKLVDLRLFNNFKFRQVLNTKEVNNYAELIFKRLLNYYNKKNNMKVFPFHFLEKHSFPPIMVVIDYQPPK